MVVGLYLVLGLGAVGALYWLLMQITARQRRLSAELVRLERLAAEVAMSAEAVLDKVDERVEHLDRLLATAEARAAEAAAAEAPGAAQALAPAPAPGAEAPAPAPGPAPVAEAPAAADAPATEEAPAPKKRSRKKKASATVDEGSAQAPAAEAQSQAPAPAAEAPAPAQTPAPAPEPLAPEPTSIARYQGLRASVWALADQGKSAGDIARELGLPRGEVQLMLNLRTKKVTA